MRSPNSMRMSRQAIHAAITAGLHFCDESISPKSVAVIQVKPDPDHRLAISLKVHSASTTSDSAKLTASLRLPKPRTMASCAWSRAQSGSHHSIDSAWFHHPRESSNCLRAFQM